MVQDKYKKQLIEIIRKHLPACTIYLFGSRATGKQRLGSDIDLALDDGKEIPSQIITRILVAIDNTTIPMHVDLVDLYGASEDLRNEVIEKGVLWIR